MDNYREESDSMGTIMVPNEKYYGAQTQRSLENFNIGEEKMPNELIEAMLHIKMAAAQVNAKNNKITKEISQKIIDTTQTLLSNKANYASLFPLSIWQTGSGTQTNMNVNEVIASLANEKETGKRGGKSPVHPNDHVNYGQSSNDTFPTAMHIATVMSFYTKLLPSLTLLLRELTIKENQFKDIIKVGRTHTQDATPITLGNEFSGYAAQIAFAIDCLQQSISGLTMLAQGGTAVGTGINSYQGFDEQIAEQINANTQISSIATEALNAIIGATNIEPNGSRIHEEIKFVPHYNKFAALACNDAMVNFSAGLNNLAVSLMKICNDIRFLASGPRCGLGELVLPENEPGSSIMPGKVNPTQCEAVTMICCKVMGNHVAITIGGSNGHFELNVFKPLILYSTMQSIRLLSDGINSFVTNCLTGIKANQDRIKESLDKTLMIVTALNPYIGYDNAAKIAKKAHKENITLKEAGIALGVLTESQYDQWINLEEMLIPGKA